MYNFFISMGYVSAVLYTLLYAKKFDIKRGKAILFVAMCYATLYLCMLLLYYFISGSFGGKNIVRVFVLLPFVIPFFAVAFDIKIKKSLDFFAPIPLIVFATTHIGCNWGACCRSNITVPWGVYNYITKTYLFPNQILETVVAGLSVTILLCLLHKKKFDMNGKAMGYMLIVYGTQRFLLEFIRDNEKLFFGISELGLWSLATVIAGFSLNFILAKRKKDISMQVQR